MSNAGGAAVHAGVNYQQRISAILLISLYSKFDLSNFFEHTTPLTPEAVSYETAAAIDDINIKCKEATEVFIQAKRSISLSERDTSEFVSVIDQFVRSFLMHPSSDHLYILITSPSSSKRVIYDLKKILDSIRLNDTAFESNPLSKQESTVLATYKSVFSACYKKHSETEETDAVFVDFSKKVMVLAWDVESGMSFEKVAIVLLHSNGFSIPQLIWNHLIAQSVYYASQRMSLDYMGIKGILDKYKFEDMSADEIEPLINELLGPGLIDVEKMPVGKEVLLVASFKEEVNVILVECPRFDKNGDKRKLIEGANVLLDNGKTQVPIIQRFASVEAFKHFCNQNPEIATDKSLGIMSIGDTKNIENSMAARSYRDICTKLFRDNKQLDKCLHSGRSCLTNNAYLVELDSPALPPAVGLVCADELRPLDRILGFRESNTDEDLPNIDLAAWLTAIQKGQGLVNSVHDMPIMEQQIIVGWNDANPNESSYRYCIKFSMEDGSFKYSYIRGKIHRLPKYEAEAQNVFFNKKIIEMNDAGNPFCLNSETWAIGPISFLEQTKKSNEVILKVVQAEVCKYSDILGKTYNRCENYYAPLCSIRSASTDQTLVLDKMVPLLSDPFSLNKMLINWAKVGIEIGDVVLSVIKNDYEFDDFIREIMKDGLMPVIDPLMHEDGSAAGGIMIKTIEELKQEAKNAEELDLQH